MSQEFPTVLCSLRFLDKGTLGFLQRWVWMEGEPMQVHFEHWWDWERVQMETHTL